MSIYSELEEWKWYLKQLIPLTYWTEYGKNDRLYFCIWRMWFGRCFEITEFEIPKKNVKK